MHEKRLELLNWLRDFDSHDPEAHHSKADMLLANYIDAMGDTELATALREARHEVGWWYA